VSRIPLAIWVVIAFSLAGCQERLSLEEAQARCAQQGGLLVVIHSQKISRSGAVGPDQPSPGDCVSPSKFDVAQPAASAPAPAPASH